MKTTFLDFEQAVAELETKIEELRYVQDGEVQRVHSPATLRKLEAFIQQRTSAPAGPAAQPSPAVDRDATPTRDQSTSSPPAAPSPAPASVKASKPKSKGSAAVAAAH